MRAPAVSREQRFGTRDHWFSFFLHAQWSWKTPAAPVRIPWTKPRQQKVPRENARQLFESNETRRVVLSVASYAVFRLVTSASNVTPSGKSGIRRSSSSDFFIKVSSRSPLFSASIIDTKNGRANFAASAVAARARTTKKARFSRTRKDRRLLELVRSFPVDALGRGGAAARRAVWEDGAV